MASSTHGGDRNHPDHPENDLSDDADFANMIPPEPRSAEELAESGDPVLRMERNRASTRQAIWYLVGVVVSTVVFAVVLGLIFRMMGGPLCTPDTTTWLCTESAETWFSILASLPPIIGLIGCGIIMVRKLKRFLRWRPWMGVFWFLVPFTMAWLTFTLGILARQYV